MKIFLDGDDTLAAFKQHCVHLGCPDWSGSWYTTPKDQWTDEQKSTQAYVNSLMSRRDFWPQLPVMGGAHELLAAAALRGEAYILTALPSALDHNYWSRIKAQKLAYYERKFHMPLDRVIVCQRKDKIQYATTWTTAHGIVRHILIDDAKQNCDEWGEIGGIPIHFDNAWQAIEELKEYCNGPKV